MQTTPVAIHPTATNGHQCVMGTLGYDTSGCEHFGVVNADTTVNVTFSSIVAPPPPPPPTTTSYKLVIKTNGKGTASSNPSGSSFPQESVFTVTAAPDPTATWTGLDRWRMLRPGADLQRDDRRQRTVQAKIPVTRKLMFPDTTGFL